MWHTAATSGARMAKRKRHKSADDRITLKDLARHLALSPTTVSLVINASPGSDSIPRRTKQRIFSAAKKLNYRPNHFARSLRTQSSSTIGVLVPEISEGYEALVMSGIEQHLLERKYFYLVVSHHHRDELIEDYPRLLVGRGVDGIIAVDTPVTHDFGVPTVAISGKPSETGVTRVVLDHQHAANLALEYLATLGHTNIAFIKGQAFSADTDTRWEAIVAGTKRLRLRIDSKLVAQLDGDSSSPELGYIATAKLLRTARPFTALFAFNDIAAIGAMQALRESGREVPADVSVIGFDDIQSAAFQHPALTTIRQPLHEMGKIAAETLLAIIRDPKSRPHMLTVSPSLIERASTGPARALPAPPRRNRATVAI
jgi:DNA-binding LacI/PurR family transcriptional regulator